MPVWSKPVRVGVEYVSPTFSDDVQTFLTEFHNWLDSQLDEPVDAAVLHKKPVLAVHAYEDARHVTKHVDKLLELAKSLNERVSLIYVQLVASLVINASSSGGDMPSPVGLLEKCYLEKDSFPCSEAGIEYDLMAFIDRLAGINAFFSSKKQGLLSLGLTDAVSKSWLIRGDVFHSPEPRIYRLLFLGELHANVIKLLGSSDQDVAEYFVRMREFVSLICEAAPFLDVEGDIADRIADFVHNSLLLIWQRELTEKKLRDVINYVLKVYHDHAPIADKKKLIKAFQIIYTDIDDLVGEVTLENIASLLNCYEALLDKSQAELGVDYYALKTFVQLSRSSIFERQFLSFSQVELMAHIELFRQGIETGKKALAEQLDYSGQVQVAIERLESSVSVTERRIDRLDHASYEDGFIPTLASPKQIESLSELSAHLLKFYLSSSGAYSRNQFSESIAENAKKAEDFFDKALDARELAQLTYVRLTSLVCCKSKDGKIDFQRGYQIISELYDVYSQGRIEFVWQTQSAFVELFQKLSRFANLCLNSGALNETTLLINLCSVSVFQEQPITHPELDSIRALVLAEVEVIKLKCVGVKHKDFPQLLENLNIHLTKVNEVHLTDPEMQKRGVLVLLDEKMLWWEYESNIERLISFFAAFNDACRQDDSILDKAETLYYIGLLFSKFADLIDAKRDSLVDEALLLLEKPATLESHAPQYVYYVKARLEFLKVYRIASKGQGFHTHDQTLYAACRSGLEYSASVRQHMGNLPAEVERFEQYFSLFLELDGLSLNERKKRFNDILIKYFSLEKAGTVEVDVPLLNAEPEALVPVPVPVPVPAPALASASSEAEPRAPTPEESARQEFAAFSVFLAQTRKGPYAAQASRVLEMLQMLSASDEMLGAEIFLLDPWPQLFSDLCEILWPKKLLLSNEDKLAFLGYEPLLPKKLKSKWRKLCQIAVLDVEPAASAPENPSAQADALDVKLDGGVTDVGESGDDGSDVASDPADKNSEADVVAFAGALPASPPKQKLARVKRTDPRPLKKSKSRQPSYHKKIKGLMWALGFEYWDKDGCYYLADGFVYSRPRFSLTPSEYGDIVLRRFNDFVKTEDAGPSEELGYSARVKLVASEATCKALRRVNVDKFFRSIKNSTKPKTKLAAASADPVEASVSGVSPATPSPTTTRLMRELKAPDSPGGSSGSDPGYGSIENGSPERPAIANHSPASSLGEAVEELYRQFGGGGRSMFSSEPQPRALEAPSDAQRQLEENLKKPYGLW